MCTIMCIHHARINSTQNEQREGPAEYILCNHWWQLPTNRCITISYYLALHSLWVAISVPSFSLPTYCRYSAAVFAITRYSLARLTTTTTNKKGPFLQYVQYKLTHWPNWKSCFIVKCKWVYLMIIISECARKNNNNNKNEEASLINMFMVLGERQIAPSTGLSRQTDDCILLYFIVFFRLPSHSPRNMLKVVVVFYMSVSSEYNLSNTCKSPH